MPLHGLQAFDQTLVCCDEICFFVGFIFGLTSHALALELAAIFAAIQEVALAFAGQALVVAVAISAT